MGKFLGGISLDPHRDSCFKETWGTVFSLYLRDLQLGIPPLYQVISAQRQVISAPRASLFFSALPLPLNANQRTGKKKGRPGSEASIYNNPCLRFQVLPWHCKR